MTQFSPYLNFAGQAAEACAFYGEIFRAEPKIMLFGENSMGANPEHVMHAQITVAGGTMLMLSDSGMTRAADGTDAVQVGITGEDLAEGKRIAEALAEGGTTIMPMEVQMWGDAYGQVRDKFGIVWHINIAQPR